MGCNGAHWEAVPQTSNHNLERFTQTINTTVGYMINFVRLNAFLQNYTQLHDIIITT